MRYLRSYRFLFSRPGWLANWLALSACLLVPLCGPIAVLGYAFDVLEALHRGGERSYPTFQFQWFLRYLLRGLGPLILYLPVLILLVLFASVGLVVAREFRPPRQALPLLLFLLLALAAVILLMGLLLVPLALRVGLSRQLDVTPSLEFAQDFLKRVWKEMLLVGLFVQVTTQLVLGIGLMTCLVGVYPALVLTVFSQHHLMYQLYDLYLQRGGRAIPLTVKENRS
jgi:hypothetical protein